VGYEPFAVGISSRLIVRTPLGGLWLDEEQFGGICVAADHSGDGSMFYSFARGYLWCLELARYYTWEISLDWASYDAVDDEDYIDREHDIGIPVERVLYSPTSKWGVQLPDVYAAIGGTHEFLQRFKLTYPDWQGGLTRFLDSCKGANERGVDMSWARILLRHIYGDDPPGF
jgi:hypothetical protein